MNPPVPDVFLSGQTADPLPERAHAGPLYSERYVPIICARRIRQFTANKNRALAESEHVSRLAPLSRYHPPSPLPHTIGLSNIKVANSELVGLP